MKLPDPEDIIDSISFDREECLLTLIKKRLGFFSRMEVYDTNFFNFTSVYSKAVKEVKVGRYIVFIVHKMRNDDYYVPCEMEPEDVIYFTDDEWSMSVALVYKNTSDGLSDLDTTTCLSDLRNVNSKSDYKRIYKSRNDRPINLRHKDDDPFNEYMISPYIYCEDPLPLRNGYTSVLLKDFLEIDDTDDDIFLYGSNIVKPENVNLPYLELSPRSSILYHIVTAKHGSIRTDEKQTMTIDRKAIICGIQGKAFLFLPDDGPVRIDHNSKVFYIKDETKLLPQYLLIQLHQKYAQDQFNRIGFDTQAFIHSRVYIPEGNDKESLYKQMQDFAKYRTTEIENITSSVGAAPAADHPLPMGSTLNNGLYVIEENIGNGGFGKIYRAGKKTDNGWTTVAIKELYVDAYCRRRPYSDELTMDDIHNKEFAHQQHKFSKEQQNLKRLHGLTHYVPCVGEDVFVGNNTLYYEMEYIAGGTLWDHCQRRDMSARQILRAVFQAGIALHYSHTLGLLHLDITPRNIMLNDSLDGILIDFGNNKHYNFNNNQQTSAGAPARTPRYTPPEMLCPHPVMTTRTDVYALAITLYSALANIRPDERITPMADETFFHDVNSGLTNAGVSNKVKQTICKALSFDKDNRQSSVIEFLREIATDVDDKSVTDQINDLQPAMDFVIDNSNIDIEPQTEESR